MKRLIVIFALLIPALSFADLATTTTIVEPDITMLRVDRFEIVTWIPDIRIELQLGYDSAGFHRIKTERVLISNVNIVRNGQNIYSDDANDLMLDLPPAYQLNPATKIMQEINAGTFGGNATLKEYIELIVKTLLKL